MNKNIYNQSRAKQALMVRDLIKAGWSYQCIALSFNFCSSVLSIAEGKKPKSLRKALRAKKVGLV
jgi:hypothetical protein